MTQKKLKVAVQMFGHLRTFKDCAPKLYEYLLNKYDCDIFVHTWTKLNHNTQTWHNYHGGVANDTKEEEVRKLYPDLKLIEIEEQHPVDLGITHFSTIYNSTPSNISIFGMASMFYSMERSNKLRQEYEKKNKVKYDWIICIRPDILINTDINIDELLKTQKPENRDKGLFTFGAPFAKIIRGFIDFGMLDTFFFARPKVMDALMKNLPDVKNSFKPEHVYEYAPEQLFIDNVIKNGFIPYLVDYKPKKDFLILREPLGKKPPFRKRLIRFYIWKKRTLLLWLFPGFFPPIFDFKISLFNIASIYLSFGEPAKAKEF